MSSGRSYDPVRPLTNMDANRHIPILPPPNMLMNGANRTVVLPPISALSNENLFIQPIAKPFNAPPSMKHTPIPPPIVPTFTQMPTLNVPHPTCAQPKKRKSDTQEPPVEAQTSGTGVRTERAGPAKKTRINDTGNSAKEVGKKSKPGESALDVSGVQLDGEDTGDVPVYDTCDEIRKKIRAMLRKDGVTKAALCRAIGASFAETRSIQGKQLDSFLNKKGPTAGNTSGVYYGSYVFFEKLRLKQGKPKTAMRLEMEKRYSGGNGEKPGINVTEMMDYGYFTLHESETITQDKYGQIEIISKHMGRPVFGPKF